MQWFPSQGIMFHAADNIKCLEDNFQSLLKLLSMFKINVWYDDTIGNKDLPKAVGIMYTDFGKIIGCLLYNQAIENSKTTFVTNMVFHNVGLSWIIRSN